MAFMSALLAATDMLEHFAAMEGWVEGSFALFFIIGFVVMKYEVIFERTRGKWGKKAGKCLTTVEYPMHSTIESNMLNGSPSGALAAWRTVQATTATPVDTLKLVVEALSQQEPASLVTTIADHITAHPDFLRNGRTGVAVLEAVAKSGDIPLMEQMAKALQSELHISPSCASYEALMGGYAHDGNYDKVSELKAEMYNYGHRLTVKGHSLIIKGLLKNSMVTLAYQEIQDMRKKGLSIPVYALAHLFRIAGNSNSASSLFSEAYINSEMQLPLPSEVVGIVLEECVKQNDVVMALRIEKMARVAKTPLLFVAYDALLKLCIAHKHAQTHDVFARMQEDGARISDSFCVGLLAKCAEHRFLRFAEEIVRFVQAKNGMTLVMYSALMKVYAYCGLYDKACDLYPRMCKQGLEPDSVMYGCLMKFSVECGRTDLSRELFDKAPSLDIQNYMSLMRAAARDRDVDRAFAILEKLKAAGIKADKAAYNCVLDACSTAGDMDRARELMTQIKELHAVDVITYNTLLKGYCSTGDLKGARELFDEMDEAGLHPNDVSYNCLINAAVSKGAFVEAWDMIDLMRAKGVPVDKYTLSIVMKSLKRNQDVNMVTRGLALLDETGIDVCSDEVLLNNVLETCTRHQQLDRLVALLEDFSRCKLNPTVHTYACIIKACSALKQPEKCKTFWKDMTEQRALEPNDIVFGCMLDALVCNGCVDDAVELFQAWKKRIPPNTVIYSTLIKGFANSRRAAEAVELLEEMRNSGFKLNTFVYNALIDTHARVGDVDVVGKLLEAMEKDGCSPNSVTYSTIVKAYCVKGEIEKAFDVFHEMQAKSMAKDCIVYNTLLDGCAQAGRMDLANNVLKSMQKGGIKASNYTLSSLVKLYGKCHQVDTAFAVIEEYKTKYGISANAKVYTCLIHACINDNYPDRALQVFYNLRDSGYTVDARLYGVMITGCVRHWRFEEAMSVIEDACKRVRSGRDEEIAKVLGGEAVEKLLEALSQQDGCQEKAMASALIDKLRSSGVHVSGKLLSKAMPLSGSKQGDAKGVERYAAEESSRSNGNRKHQSKNSSWNNRW
jgi:pentatricopeptide repeat protein